MSRRKSLVITAAGSLAVLALIAGCVSAPLTDARKILTNAQASLKNLNSVHFHLEAGGQFIFGMEAAPTPAPTVSPSPSVSASASASTSASAGASSSATPTPTPTATPTPTPSPSPTLNPSASASASVVPTATPTPLYTAVPISLKGSVADGDIDFANKSAHMVGGAPGLPGFSGELIIVGQYAYSRPYGATQYTLSSATSLALNPADPAQALYIVSQMVAVANDLGLVPVLVGTEQEPGGSAYHIRVSVSQSALNSGLAALQVVQALGSGKLDLWITQDGFQLERLEFSTSDPNSGVAAVRLVLSNWNGVSPIDVPPDNQIDTGASPSALASY